MYYEFIIIDNIDYNVLTIIILFVIFSYSYCYVCSAQCILF